MILPVVGMTFELSSPVDRSSYKRLPITGNIHGETIACVRW